MDEADASRSEDAIDRVQQIEQLLAGQMLDDIHEQYRVQRSVVAVRKKFSHVAQFGLRNAQAMGELDLLPRRVDSGDPGVSGTRQEAQKSAVPTSKINDTCLATLRKIARDDLADVGLAGAQQLFGFDRIILLSRLTA